MVRIRIYYLLLFTISFYGCSNKSNTFTAGVIEFDVTKEYPEITIDIHDIADVSYVILDINDDFIFSYPNISTTENYIIVFDNQKQCFLFFDKKGNAISKVSHVGSGPEEYLRVHSYIYVEEEDNLYLYINIPPTNQRILTFDKNGNYKTKYSIPDSLVIERIYQFNQNTLLCYCSNQQKPFKLFDKDSRTFVGEIDVFIEESIDLLVRVKELVLDNGMVLYDAFAPFPGNYVVQNEKDILLNEYSLDTIYQLTSDYNLIPKMIRKPNMTQTDPMIAVHGFIETPDYIFFSTTRQEYIEELKMFYPKTGYLMDKENHVFRQNIINRDFERKSIIIDPSMSDRGSGVIFFSVDELMEADNQNRLKGELKKVYDSLGEEDEYVFMLINFK